MVEGSASCRPSHVTVSELLRRLDGRLPAHALAALKRAAAPYARREHLDEAQSLSLARLFAAAAAPRVLAAALSSPPACPSPPAPVPNQGAPGTPAASPAAPPSLRCIDPTHGSACAVCEVPPSYEEALRTRSELFGCFSSPKLTNALAVPGDGKKRLTRLLKDCPEFASMPARRAAASALQAEQPQFAERLRNASDTLGYSLGRQTRELVNVEALTLARAWGYKTDVLPRRVGGRDEDEEAASEEEEEMEEEAGGGGGGGDSALASPDAGAHTSAALLLSLQHDAAPRAHAQPRNAAAKPGGGAAAGEGGRWGRVGAGARAEEEAEMEEVEGQSDYSDEAAAKRARTRMARGGRRRPARRPQRRASAAAAGAGGGGSKATPPTKAAPRRPSPARPPPRAPAPAPAAAAPPPKARAPSRVPTGDALVGLRVRVCFEVRGRPVYFSGTVESFKVARSCRRAAPDDERRYTIRFEDGDATEGAHTRVLGGSIPFPSFRIPSIFIFKFFNRIF